jgi:hypothetical protein
MDRHNSARESAKRECSTKVCTTAVNILHHHTSAPDTSAEEGAHTSMHGNRMTTSDASEHASF